MVILAAGSLQTIAALVVVAIVTNIVKWSSATSIASVLNVGLAPVIPARDALTTRVSPVARAQIVLVQVFAVGPSFLGRENENAQH